MVTPGSGLEGMTIQEIEAEHETRVYMLLRDELTIVATGDVILKTGDILIVRTNKLVKK